MVMGSLAQATELAIIGSGPGGYVAAIRAADLGKEVVVIEEHEKLGGVCLRAGCIPSKALINAVELINSAREAKKMGVTFQDPTVDLDTLRNWTNTVVEGLTGGVGGLLMSQLLNSSNVSSQLALISMYCLPPPMCRFGCQWMH
jgi:dihydrolipoamide dehydrogenase